MPRKRVGRKKRVMRKKRVYKRKPRKMTSIETLTLRSPGVIVPDRYRVKLQYVDTTSNLLGAGGSTFGFIRYFANQIFDCNPLILTSAAPGASELFQLYKNYRVKASSITLNVSNMMDNPVNAMIFPSNTDVASSASYGFIQEQLANPYTKWRSLASKGGMDRAFLKNYLSTRKITGDIGTKYDEDYVGSSTANAARSWYWNIASYSLSQTGYSVASIPFEVRITYYVEFFNRFQFSA